MSSHKKNAHKNHTPDRKNPEGAAPEQDVRETNALRAEIEALQAELEKAKAKNEELNDLRLRDHAEFENFKKRRLAEQERHEKMALRSMMTELIEVDSNFRHALAGGEGDFEAYRKGVEMIAGQLEAVLGRHGVSRIAALGQPFDHDLHEAMLQVEEGTHEGLRVAAVLREGYVMHDQVLRLAGVKVAKGDGSEPDPEDADENKENSVPVS